MFCESDVGTFGETTPSNASLSRDDHAEGSNSTVGFPRVDSLGGISTRRRYYGRVEAIRLGVVNHSSFSFRPFG